MKQILTLCERCRTIYAESYSIKPYTMERATTKPEKKCANCRKTIRDMRMYLVDKKR